MNGRTQRIGMASAPRRRAVLDRGVAWRHERSSLLQRAEALQRLGPLALAMPRRTGLESEVIAAGKRYQARIEADRKRGANRRVARPRAAR